MEKKEPTRKKTNKKENSKETNMKVVDLPESTVIVENQQKKSKMQPWLIVILIVVALFSIFPLIILGVGFYYTTNIETFVENNNIVEIAKGDLTIDDKTVGYYNDTRDIYYVEGYLHNNTNKTYYDFEIEYTIYDIEGNVLGFASTEIEKLNAHETWKFKAKYDEVDAEKALTFKFSSFSF